MVVSEKEIQVRYAETDQMGVVYHANYIIWMELGRTQLIEDLGYRYADMEKDGFISPVIEVQVRYKSPVRYGEKAVIKTWIEEYDGLRVTYGYEVLTEKGDVAIQSTSQHVCAKKDSFRPVAMRKYFPDWHEAYLKAME
ncbi:acyl-CoA thioester hydrolase [Oikeobacillus pervagus]|uniref:Acyl-CoA thioester hydrolase n=1 Tax=Oikeobacillus pervagus TaxID=1325931 RepID=A0AAJ1WI74_9BACI|nr:thioesterase family protein [Oikeobacillus pervagus]MDQ0214048.1 acyl-CoA thioester hydrolase [Oikeobacillus pervagus]